MRGFKMTKTDFSRELGFVDCAYVLSNLGIDGMGLQKLKSYNLIKPYLDSEGKKRRGYYTYDSYRDVKDFMDKYKGAFGHPASLHACVLALEKKNKGR
jgi:hypothetical protein